MFELHPQHDALKLKSAMSIVTAFVRHSREYMSNPRQGGGLLREHRHQHSIFVLRYQLVSRRFAFDSIEQELSLLFHHHFLIGKFQNQDISRIFDLKKVRKV